MGFQRMDALAWGTLLMPVWEVSVVRASAISCSTSLDCQERVHSKSSCRQGRCSNPYHEGGCLQDYLQQQQEEEGRPRRQALRTCHSEDGPPSAGVCEESPFGYPEVRIHAQNWESSLFTTWILQVVLSELLQVPVTVETGTAEGALDFYHVDASFVFGNSNDWDSVRRGSEVLDCRQWKSDNNEDYNSCSNVVAELWPSGNNAFSALREEGAVETSSLTGMLGIQNWYIPRFTAERDPSLASYLGLSGEKNRRKLAERFLEPTTWKDYCQEVSNTTCLLPDDVAMRAPRHAAEEDRFFVKGLYNGHFRKTERNDCDKWPFNCTGHIMDYPCGWGSNVKPQTYHHNIALASNGKQGVSGGFTPSQLVEAWDAANATKSDIISLYWQPSALHQKYVSTPAEFITVPLPQPTIECVRNRIDAADRCTSKRFTEVYGDPIGACNDQILLLDMLIGSSVFQSTLQHGTSTGLRTPAYDVLRNFRITSLQSGVMLGSFLNGEIGDAGLDARKAVCDWIVENVEDLRHIIPDSYPRAIREDTGSRRGNVFYSSTAVSTTALFTVFVAALGIIRFRDTLHHYARVEFMILLLVGNLLVSLGALLIVLRPSDGICVAVEFLTNWGYTIELIPSLEKIAKILRVRSARAEEPDGIQHTEEEEFLSKRTLFLTFFVSSIFMLSSLIIITIVAPTQVAFEFHLTDDVSDWDEFIVGKTPFCGGEYKAMTYFGFLWQFILLLTATCVSLKTQRNQNDKESRALAFFMYSHFLFLVLRAMTYFLRESLGHSNAYLYRSILFGGDVMATLAIYFLPKIVHSRDSRGRTTPSFANEVDRLRASVAISSQNFSRSTVLPTSRSSSEPTFSVRDESSDSVVDRPNIRPFHSAGLLPVAEDNNESFFEPELAKSDELKLRVRSLAGNHSSYFSEEREMDTQILKPGPVAKTNTEDNTMSNAVVQGELLIVVDGNAPSSETEECLSSTSVNSSTVEHGILSGTVSEREEANNLQMNPNSGDESLQHNDVGEDGNCVEDEA